MHREAPGSDRARVEGIVGASRSVLDGAQELARHSRRASWLAWGFLYAAWGGFLVLVLTWLWFTTTTTTFGSGGTMTTVVPPPDWWIPVPFLPAAVLLLWAVSEIFAGRAASRAAIRGARAVSDPRDLPREPVGWTQQVVEAQKLLTAAKMETDWTFLPLAMGLLGGTLALDEGVFDAVGGLASTVQLGLIVVGVALVSFALYLLYRVAREWVGGFQAHLDRQVRDVSALEAEFLWRFAGTPA